MKKVIIITVLAGMVIKGISGLPSSELSPVCVYGTEKIEKQQEQKKPEELRYMDKKMYYLKTGKTVNTESNYEEYSNFWGKGQRARTHFPEHLALWEASRSGVPVLR